MENESRGLCWKDTFSLTVNQTYTTMGLFSKYEHFCAMVYTLAIHLFLLPVPCLDVLLQHPRPSRLPVCIDVVIQGSARLHQNIWIKKHPVAVWYKSQPASHWLGSILHTVLQMGSCPWSRNIWYWCTRTSVLPRRPDHYSRAVVSCSGCLDKKCCPQQPVCPCASKKDMARMVFGR